MFKCLFLVVFEIGDRPRSRIGNGVFGFNTNDPEVKSPTTQTVKNWEQEIRELLDESTIVITGFFPLAN